MVLGIIGEIITKDLLFHIIPLNIAKESQEKFECVYCNEDEDKAFTIQEKIFKLDPKKFDTIQEFIYKVNDFREQLRNCDITIKDS